MNSAKLLVAVLVLTFGAAVGCQDHNRGSDSSSDRSGGSSSTGAGMDATGTTGNGGSGSVGTGR